jgi:ABC-type phosphate/phosphonate transport system substrate-binding protein
MAYQSTNFSFLSGISSDLDRLYGIVTQAEMYLYSDSETSLIKICKFGELLAQEIAARNGEFKEEKEDQLNLLKRLKGRIFGEEIARLFHEIRINGNKAKHERELINACESAIKALENAHKLAKYFYISYISRDIIIPDFVEPESPVDMKSEFEKLQNQLAESQNREEIHQTSEERSTVKSRELEELLKTATQEQANLFEEILIKEKELEELQNVANKEQLSLIENHLSENKRLQELLRQEIQEKNEFKYQIGKLQADSSAKTEAEKQATIDRANQQEQSIKISGLDLHNYSRTKNGSIGHFAGIGIAAISLLLVAKSWGYLTKTKIVANNITIGIMSSVSDYRDLQSYLRENLVPENYIDYLMGKQIGISLDGDGSLSYQEVKNRIANKKWDIAFARSPMMSRFAQKQSYSYLAAMFPGSQNYKSGIFVRADSSIKSIDDIKSSTVVALGHFESASSFYMPAYDLYGKTFSLARKNSSSPKKRVKAGEAEVGAGAIGDSIQDKDPTFRIIHISRDIPGSGVYLSPQLATEYEKIKQVLLSAPEKIRSDKKANYGDAPEAHYQEFDKITDRVDSLIECVDFKKNPVKLFCDKKLASHN